MDKATMIRNYEDRIYSYDVRIDELEDLIRLLKKKIAKQEDVYEKIKKSRAEVEEQIRRKSIINEAITIKFPTANFMKISSEVIKRFETKNNNKLIYALDEDISDVKNEIVTNYNKLDDLKRELKSLNVNVMKARNDLYEIRRLIDE